MQNNVKKEVGHTLGHTLGHTKEFVEKTPVTETITDTE